MKYIPYGRQTIDESDVQAVLSVLQSDWLTQGPVGKEFEEAVAAYHGCRYAVSFCNGTAALHGAYHVSKTACFGKDQAPLAEQDSFSFITTPITFAASANAGLYCGGQARFVDIDPTTLNLDLTQVEAAIDDTTRVITPVSYGGYPVDLQRLRALPKVQAQNLCIIHDACHAIGAKVGGNSIVDFADMTVLSFHPVKHLCTAEGGMVLTNNVAYYEKLMRFRTHGITKNPSEFIADSHGDWYHEMQELGHNYRLTDLQAGLGLSQLQKLNQSIYRRNEIAEMYDIALQELSWIKLPPRFDRSWLQDTAFQELNRRPDNLHSYHLYPIQVEKGVDRKALFDHLRQHGIGVQVHYLPVTMHPYYNQPTPPQANAYYNSTISLPMYHHLTTAEVAYVIDTIKAFM